jgi:hypothetical protein
MYFIFSNEWASWWFSRMVSAQARGNAVVVYAIIAYTHVHPDHVL